MARIPSLSCIAELGGNEAPIAIFPGFPIAIIPPGYRLQARAALLDVGQQATFWWCCINDGQ